MFLFFAYSDKNGTVLFYSSTTDKILNVRQIYKEAITINIASLWNSKDEGLWKKSMENYWNLVKPENFLLEKELERLVPANINNLRESEWFEFLLKKYFKWKYTAPNRYSSTTKHLKAYKENNRLGELLNIRNRILAPGERGDIGNAKKKICILARW